MHAHATRLTEQEQYPLQYVASSKDVLIQAYKDDAFIRQWMDASTSAGVTDKDALVVMCAELYKLKQQADQKLLDTIKHMQRPLIMVASVEHANAIKTLLGVPDANT